MSALIRVALVGDQALIGPVSRASSARATGSRSWPNAALRRFGDVMNLMKKYVVSNSLQAAEWQNTEIISGDVASKIAALKAQDGGDIAMSGSATTVRWLLHGRLPDELHLLVHPIVVGEGMARLFPADEPQVPLELLSSKTFGSGVLHVVYAPAN
jgi:dihydrofolate reductase